LNLDISKLGSAEGGVDLREDPSFIDWINEEQFKNFRSCIRYVTDQVVQCNREIQEVAPEKLITLHFVDACPPQQFQNQNKEVLVTNNHLPPGVLDSKYYQEFSPSWYGIYAGDVAIEEITPIKNFNCFIKRMDPIRQSWFYQLIRRNILDQGYVSFMMDIFIAVQMGQFSPTTSLIEAFESQFKSHLAIFAPEHEFIKNQVPYRNFDDSVGLNKIIMQSKFSIVLETCFDRNDSITYSEKIFRCLKLPRPWLVFSMKGAVQHLRDIGFDVLDDLVDHSYDNIDFEIDRQVAILDTVQELSKLEFTPAVLDRLNTAARHNQEKLNTFFNTWHKDIDVAVDLAKDKCLAL